MAGRGAYGRVLALLAICHLVRSGPSPGIRYQGGVNLLGAVRPATREDLVPVARLLSTPDGAGWVPAFLRARADEARWRRALQGRLDAGAEHVFFVAAVDRDIVGCVELGMIPSGDERLVPFVANLVVRRDYRRKGLGRQLLSSACHWAFERWREDEVFTKVDPCNMPAATLYERFGFALPGGQESSSRLVFLRLERNDWRAIRG